MPGLNGRRVAVVAGVRTPFSKAGTALKNARAVDLGRYATRELLERTNLDGHDVDEVIFGQVVPSALVPNIGREVSLLPQFPKEIPAYSLNRACASANQAISAGHDQIALGNANVVIAGGAEALSDIPILASRRLADILVEASKAKSLGARISTFAKIRPKDLVPVAPAIAEPSTGESMGQSAEKMAKENHIPREEQDRWALRSHTLAAQGTADGRLTAEIVPGLSNRPGDAHLRQDNGIRPRPLARANAKAQAGVRSKVRHRHGGEFVTADRRRLGRAAHERRARPLTRLRAADVHPLVCRRGGRSRLAAAPGPDLRGAEGARARGYSMEGSRIDRDPRGIRIAGALESPGLRRQRLGDQRRHHQRHGRLDRDRPSVRRDRRPTRDDAVERNEAARRAVRLDLGLRARGHGLRDGPGTPLMATLAKPMSSTPAVTWDIDDGIATVVLDLKGQPVNVDR